MTRSCPPLPHSRRSLSHSSWSAWHCFYGTASAAGDSHTQPTKEQLFQSLTTCLALSLNTVAGDDSADVDVLDWLSTELQCVDSPDAIDDLFTVELPKLVLHFTAVRQQADEDTGVLPVVDANSAFGLFIRHQQLMYNCASFDDVGRLYEQMVEYVAGKEITSTLSPTQLVAFVRSQAAAVQSSVGRQSYSQMERSCDEVADAASASAPAASALLCYVTALAACDFEEATRQLHRFADISSSLEPTVDGGDSGSGRMRTGLLNLALLHGRFGQTELCVELPR